MVHFIRRRPGGKVRLYPANELAETFCKLTGWKTCPPDRVPYIEALGYEVQVTEAN